MNAASQLPGLMHLSTPGFGQIQNALFALWALLAIALPRPWGWRTEEHHNRVATADS